MVYMVYSECQSDIYGKYAIVFLWYIWYTLNITEVSTVTEEGR